MEPAGFSKPHQGVRGTLRRAHLPRRARAGQQPLAGRPRVAVPGGPADGVQRDGAAERSAVAATTAAAVAVASPIPVRLPFRRALCAAHTSKINRGSKLALALSLSQLPAFASDGCGRSRRALRHVQDPRRRRARLLRRHLVPGRVGPRMRQQPALLAVWPTPRRDVSVGSRELPVREARAAAPLTAPASAARLARLPTPHQSTVVAALGQWLRPHTLGHMDCHRSGCLRADLLLLVPAA